MKLAPIVPYLKKNAKIHGSRDTPLASADISIFHQKLAIIVISGNTSIDCILVHKF